MAATWALVNELFMIASSLCAAIGIGYIRKRATVLHRMWMLTAASLGVCFFVSYVLGSLIVGDTAFGGPRSLDVPYQIFLLLHIALAITAGVMGVLTIRAAVRQRFDVHRRLAPMTATLWFIAAGTGLLVYLLLFVFFSPGQTVNLFHAL